MLLTNLDNGLDEKLVFCTNGICYEPMFLCLQLHNTKVSTVDVAQLSRVCNPTMIIEW